MEFWIKKCFPEQIKLGNQEIAVSDYGLLKHCICDFNAC